MKGREKLFKNMLIEMQNAIVGIVIYENIKILEIPNDDKFSQEIGISS